MASDSEYFSMGMDNDYPLMIEEIKLKDQTFNLIQETYLPAGTKQRGISYFYELKEQGINEVVTYGTTHGYGQVATSWCCAKVGLKCTIFVAYVRPRTKMTKLAIKFGANVIETFNPSTATLATKARNYFISHDKCKLVQLGLDDEDFIRCLAEGIRNASYNINPKRIWVAGGSGVLARALSMVFPNAELHIVQVGRRLYPDVLAQIKHRLYISPERFRHNAEYMPPYTSLHNYDAKIWRFVLQYGQDGDFIWNVK